MERRELLRLIAAGSAMSLLQRAFAAGEIPGAQGIRRMRGQVSVNGQPGRIGMAIRPGDTVVTGMDAEALYVVEQDAFLQRGNSAIIFGAEAGRDFLRVISGRLLSVFGHGNKRLAVGTATIGIRGTACYIEEERSRTYFCLCYGEAEVVPTAAPAQRETIRTTHHDHPIYIHADPAMATSMVSADIVNHSDAELVMLEGLVGRWPPFYGMPGLAPY